jgi:aminoacrylate hydrolase
MMKTAKIPLDWGALQIEEAGDGDPLLLISGLNGLAQPWRGIMPALAAEFRVIAHDHRGLGGSDRWDGAYSVDQIAADVLGLMDALGIARAHIVGHSLGGAVAQALAADHPSRVAGVAIYASWPGPDAYFARVMTMRQEMLTGLGVETFLRTGPIGIYPPHWITAHDAAFAAALPALLAAFPGVNVMLRRMQACLAHDRRASLSRIAAPCLVLGLQDDMSTPAYCSEELAAAIPDAKLVLLPMGGHNAHLVVPDQIAKCLLDFFCSPHVAGATNTIKEGESIP